ncbi:MAG: beta-lactamase family protein [Verrucomicrobiales bacterium]|nr:beta-lactamase family protein [Verrucomicrobiales bacterium]
MSLRPTAVRTWLTLLLVFGAARPVLTAPAATDLSEPAPTAGDPRVAALLETARKKAGVPALAGAVVTTDGLQAIATSGWRKAGAAKAVTPDDSWHLGSETKAMTATLAGRLVERGLLRWNTTLAERFPGLADDMHPDLREVSLEQLLTHRAGLPANLRWSSFDRSDVRKARREVVREATARAPLHPPGSKVFYSNLGYVIAGAMIEQALDQPWEQAIVEEVFEPLGMRHVGFGGTGTPGELDQPWGHFETGKPVPSNGPDTDNPPVLGPAGRVHAPLQDWALFITDQLRGARGEGRLLRPETYRRIQTPVGDDRHAMGWIVVPRGWAGGPALNHTGSNTMNYANVWIAPAKGFAILICCNQGGDGAFQATDNAVAALIPVAAAQASAGDSGH